MRNVGIGVFGLGVMMAGCGTFTDIEGSDTGVFMPVTRVTSRLVPAPEGAAPSHSPFSPAFYRVVVEGELAYGRGNSVQDLDSDDSLRFDDTDFNVPGTVRADYELLVGSVSARGGYWPAETFGVEGIFGMGFHDVKLALHSNAVDAQDSTFSWGPLFGVQLTARPTERVSLYARFTTTLGLEEDTIFGASEIGSLFAPAPAISLLAGWRWWDYAEDRSGESNVDLQLSGPMIGVQLDF